MPLTVDIANENAVAGRRLFLEALSSSVAGQVPYFTGTDGYSLGATNAPATAQTVTPSGAATVSLTAAQTGGCFLFDSAAGVVYTLPAPVVGLKYRFIVTTTITSNAAKVITSAGTIFLVGAINYGILDTTPGANPGPKFTAANGSTHVSISSNGTTTGGIIGSDFTVTCISATLWYITGQVIASGTISTPFATS